MLRFFLDIEGTVLDSLQSRRFLEFNCDQIKKFIAKRVDGVENYKLFIYTWGWKQHKDIEPELVKEILAKVGVTEDHYGRVYVKEDAIELIADTLWGNLHSLNLVNEPKSVGELKEWLLRPGAIGQCGYSKVVVAEEFAKHLIGPHEYILIDDLVTTEDEKHNYYHLETVNPNRLAVRINNDIDPVVTLYSPDNQPVGEIRNEAALNNVCVQICKQHLTGFYFVYKGQKIRIDGNGCVEDYPDGCFDYIFKSVGELMKNAKPLREQIEDYKNKHPELVNRSCQD